MTTDTDDVFDKAAELIWLASWSFAGLWFLSIVGYQFLHWLRFGTWKEIPFVAVFHYFDIELSAVYDPQNWIGIAHIAQWLLPLPSHSWAPC